MYTSSDYEDRDYDEYDDEREIEDEDESFYQRNKGIIFKILIIILCVIILLWLISKLNNKKTEEVQTKSNYEANVTQVRLASEQYFFINNKPTSSSQKITVSNLIVENLIKEVKNSNGTACRNDSEITLENNGVNYVMTIKLDCGSESKTNTYYYRLSDYACENCNGTTYMTGNNNQEVPEEPEEPETPEEPTYSCNWTEWSTERKYDSNLLERSRVVVRAVKQSQTEEVTYGEWTGYTENPITPTDTLEVETKQETFNTWVDRTSSSRVYESSTIRNVTRHTSGGTKYTYCPDGYEKVDGRCRKGTASRTISATDYLKLSYNERKNCYSKRETPNKLVYVCGGGYTYTDLKTGYTGGSTTYSYQELVTTTRTLYRSRTKTVQITITEPVYTDYILESEIPAGYTKIAGSERTEYSYKYNSCSSK